MKLTRRALLGGAAGAAGLTALDAFAVEPRWLDVTRHDVPVAGLPSALRGVTVAQLTDVHLHALAGLHEAAARAVDAANAALVVLTGDVVDDPATLPALTALCDLLRGRGRVVLATRGNWEHWGRVPLDALRRAYAHAGAELLVNEQRTAHGVVVAATDDGYSGNADVTATLRDLPPGGARLLLTHSPGLLDDEAPRHGPRFDLALAGHTHGGQVRAAVTHLATPPGSGRFVAGFYDTPFGRAYVSRGVGTSVVPARLFCRPELPLFRFVQG